MSKGRGNDRTERSRGASLNRRSILRYAVAGGGLAVGLPLAATSVAAATLNVPGDHATIQEAVDAADPGDTIQVDAGSYGESVDVTTADLTIRGDPGDASTTGPGPDAPTTDKFAFGASAAGVTITGFILDGSDGIDVDIGGDDTLSDVTVSHNRLDNTELNISIGSESDGVTLSNCRLVNNIIDGGGNEGILLNMDNSFANADIDVLIGCNEIVNTTNDAIDLQFDDDPSNVFEIDIFNNVISATQDAGIDFETVGGGEKTINIEYNDISDTTDPAIEIDADGDATGVTVSNNNLYNLDNDGIQHLSTGVVDARNNYWGAEDGPSGGDTDPETGATADGSGEVLDGDDNVRFDPFLSEAVVQPDACAPDELTEADCIERRNAGRDTPEEDICEEPDRSGTRETGRSGGRTRSGGARRYRGR